jgi:SPX domain protein involved in polyphosphate accumulation
MVKFSKQLEGSLVPEWKGAYCNYKQLKRDVNRIKQDCACRASAPVAALKAI